MATDIPEALKAADISRFMTRAAQLEKFKPVVAYWCQYHVVNQILNKGLHTSDDDSMTYTTDLMDKLEKIKTQNADNDAISDDVAAQAYVEQFALETFQRADNAVQANKVTAQTADTFRAAATFLDLVVSTWSSSSAELASKSKYAKYHALRIAKALKAGEDPNLSNPPPPTASHPASPGAPESMNTLPPLSPSDPDVQQINQSGPGDTTTPAMSSPQQQSGLDTFPPPNQPQQYNQENAPDPPLSSIQPDVSPISQDTSADAPTSYFPPVPTFTAESNAPVLAPEVDPDTNMTTPAADPRNFYASPTFTAPAAPPPPTAPSHIIHPPPQAPAAAPLPTAPPVPPYVPSPVVRPNEPTPSIASQPVVQQQQQHVQQPRYLSDDEAVLAAQKHARWAISALNFEDVGTAVKELRTALRALGAG